MPAALKPLNASSKEALLAKEQLMRDLERLTRLQRLDAQHGDALSERGVEVAAQLQASLFDSLLESAKTFVHRARQANGLLPQHPMRC